MEKYLGETKVKIAETPFKDFTPADWALYYVGRYGQIDGAHHKQWVLDQIARILNDAPITVKVARWLGGHEEHRVSVGTSPKYQAWVEEMKGEKNDEGEYEYDYDEGVAP